MARFYGDLTGDRGAVTRRGTPNSGIKAHVRSWSTGVRVYVSADGDVDVVEVWRTGGSHNSGDNELLASFRSDDKPKGSE